MEFVISLLSALSFMIGPVSLLSKRMDSIWYIILLSYFYCIYHFFQGIGQWATFLLLFGNIVIIYLGCQRQLLEVIFSLCGYLILIFIDHLLTIPLSFLGYLIPYLRQYFFIIFTVIEVLIAVPVLYFLRKYFIIPKLTIFQTCPQKLLKVFFIDLLLNFFLFTFNFIYGEKFGYPTSILTWNGTIISILSLANILVFYNMYNILKENHDLILQQAQSEIMQDYTKRMELFYEDVRTFRHDYRNILATLQDYIDNENIKELQYYYHSKILSNTEILSDDGYILGKLHLIEDSAVKSLLYTKMIAVFNKKLSFELELSQPIPILPMDNLTLCRILGILIDNAVEAAAESPEKLFRLAILRESSSVVFILANSTLPLQFPLSKLSEPGYSSKKGHSGLGLAIVRKMLAPLSDALLQTECSDNIFRQILEISTQE